MNGGSLVGAELARLFEGTFPTHIVFPVTWAATNELPVTAADGYTHIIGFGEGHDDYVVVERYASPDRLGKDTEGKEAPARLPGVRPYMLDLKWGPNEVPTPGRGIAAPTRRELCLPWADEAPELPAIVEGTNAGRWVCNALAHTIGRYFDRGIGVAPARTERIRGGMQRQRPIAVGGFIHVPPANPWMERTGMSSERYTVLMTRAVICVLRQNRWIG